MLGRISIFGGPSREELFDALRLMAENRKVVFVIKDDTGKRVDMLSGISMLRPEDGSGNHWLFEMHTTINNSIQRGSGYIDTRTRTGYLDI